MTNRAELIRLTTLAHDRTDHLPTSTALQELYGNAVTVAQRSIGGDLGDAIAGVLAMEEEQLRIRRWNSVLGQSKMVMSLALAVLATPDSARHPVSLNQRVRVPARMEVS